MTAKNLCQDCNETATGKTLFVWARGAEPKMVYFCAWHKSYYMGGA